MSNDELSAAMVSWRRLVDSRVASPREGKTHAQQLAMLNDALDVARPYLVPSSEGLFGQLAQIVQAWRTEWTNELRSSTAWSSASEKLATIRQLIDEGDLSRAEFALGDLLMRGCAGVRTLDLSVSIRHLNGDDGNDPTSKRESLVEVVERLTSI